MENEICPICNREVEAPYVTLSDGKRVHKSCQEKKPVQSVLPPAPSIPQNSPDRDVLRQFNVQDHDLLHLLIKQNNDMLMKLVAQDHEAIRVLLEDLKKKKSTEAKPEF